MEKMFCFQCEQTAGCSACTGNAGVCGKTSQTAALQDELTGALIGLARATEGNEAKLTKRTHDMVTEGLFATLTNVNFDDEALRKMIAALHEEKERLVPRCGECADSCGRNEDYNVENIWNAQEDLRSVKSLILFGLRGLAAYAYHASVLGYRDENIYKFLYRALFSLGEDKDVQELLPVAMEVGKVNLDCLALLDQANTNTYGTPQPQTVSMQVEAGPFIVVTGHDLKDLKLLLEQTKDKGINIYTHGEMLPAHGYPKLREYPHLKGHFGTAWQNQQKEFANLPAPVLFTTNCLMPPKDSYAKNIFTTGPVSWPGAVHVGEEKDFAPVIQKALELGGYDTAVQTTGVNGGTQLTTGFGHGTILSVADKVVAAVKAGDIRHFFLVGGCDGARKERSYYTEFVKETPKDTMILTLGCGKYRFNDLSLGEISGLPRLLDMGQCNDAYGAVQVALALANAFECGVNDLPLSLVLSWYEQKAVCILLSLLHLGIKHITIGPTLPAFLSPAVVKLLVEAYALTPTAQPKTDMEGMLSAKEA